MSQERLNTQRVKEANVVRVFLALKGNPLSTKNDLCTHLNLSRPTVDGAITSLLSLDLITRAGHGPSEGGRPAILYKFNGKTRYAIGGDLELPEFNLILCGLDGIPILSRGFTVPQECLTDPEKTIAFVDASIRMLVEEAGETLARTIGIGLGVPAFLKGDTITISGRTLPQWKEVPVKSHLERRLKIPVYVDNDVNFMALSENHTMGYKDNVMSYIALRRGLKNDIRMGGSTLLRGKVFHGGSGNASSLQHAYVEVDSLEKRQKEAAISVNAAGELAALIASRLIDPIKQMVRLFDPNRLVINAKILQTAEEAFIERITTQFNTELSSEFNWKIKVCKAQDQLFSCAKGGALFVLQKLFNRPSKLIKELTASPS
ncbi:MAG: ROK family transcriptional regulator [Candidatus Bipolaricaulota bacterium]|nr:ROK family transcriptional regulator [Candidatus Bipolaricaulota bacterium]